MAKRRVSLTHRKQRSVLTDMLPFEVPPTFSNRGYYRFLRDNSIEIENGHLRWVCATDALDRTMRLLFGIKAAAVIDTEVVTEWGKEKSRRSVPIGKCEMATIPFNFRVAHNLDGRTLSVVQPRIYVACLAAYNNGYLHGAWIEATDAWSMWEATRDMLAKSPIPDAEEWAIHDYEGFASIRISEYTSFERVAELAAFIAEHGNLGAELIDHFCGDLNEARSALDDRHLGQYQSLADYVQDVTEETTEIPQNLRYYIDWQSMARDCELNGDLFTIQTAQDAVHVFAGC